MKFAFEMFYFLNNREFSKNLFSSRADQSRVVVDVMRASRKLENM